MTQANKELVKLIELKRKRCEQKVQSLEHEIRKLDKQLKRLQQGFSGDDHSARKEILRSRLELNPFLEWSVREVSKYEATRRDHYRALEMAKYELRKIMISSKQLR